MDFCLTPDDLEPAVQYLESVTISSVDGQLINVELPTSNHLPNL